MIIIYLTNGYSYYEIIHTSIMVTIQMFMQIIETLYQLEYNQLLSRVMVNNS